MYGATKKRITLKRMTRERVAVDLQRAGLVCFALILFASAVSAQVFVVGRERPKNVTVFKPTSVVYEQKPITAAGRQQLITSLTAEQGFAALPLPLGTPGLVLHANGNLKYGNGDYYDNLVKKGTSAQTGDRVLITDFRIEKDRIVFDFNGGPEKKHKILRHISVGGDPNYTQPLARDDGVEPVGSRLTLVFDKYVPRVTGDDVRALIEPVIDFRTKTPIEVYTNTLPPKLRDAILNHQALVGMDRKMIVYALGQPESKVRERDGNMPYEEWIYGAVPNPIQFVRFNNGRVIRVETALYGKTPTIRDQDETNGYLNNHPAHTVAEGDVVVAANGDRPNGQAPTLRKPGEAAPQGPMQPVHNPTDPVKPSPLPEQQSQQILR
jgi:hypothetical protein